jgi:C_GCAxxG_C_C family probable redox protein
VSQALGEESDVLPRIASGFGGGIGGSGGTCGALVGAIMVVGLRYGRTNPEDDRLRAYAISQRIFDAFEGEMGATACRDLTGLDLRTTDGARQRQESGVAERVCAPAIQLAERLAMTEISAIESG